MRALYFFLLLHLLQPMPLATRHRSMYCRQGVASATASCPLPTLHSLLPFFLDLPPRPAAYSISPDLLCNCCFWLLLLLFVSISLWPFVFAALCRIINFTQLFACYNFTPTLLPPLVVHIFPVCECNSYHAFVSAHNAAINFDNVSIYEWAPIGRHQRPLVHLTERAVERGRRGNCLLSAY